MHTDIMEGIITHPIREVAVEHRYPVLKWPQFKRADLVLQPREVRFRVAD